MEQILIVLGLVILIYFIYKLLTKLSRDNPNTIPDAKERTKLFNERKKELMEKAKQIYLKKHSKDK